MIKIFSYTCCIILCVNTSVFAFITYVQKPVFYEPFLSDTIFLGSGFFSANPDSDVIVSFKTSTFPTALGILQFVLPGFPDSAIDLFHNYRTLYPSEETSVTLGKFQRGTDIIFKLLFSDTSDENIWLFGKKEYSGQNRKGIDKYYSDILLDLEPRRGCVAGRKNERICEGGFHRGMGNAYSNMMFEVSNVILEVREKSKLPAPVLVQDSIFRDSLTVTVTVPLEGLYSVVQRYPKYDTLNPLKTGATFHIAYTSDGSDPRLNGAGVKQYSAPFIIRQTTTIKAYAYFVGDTAWFPSNVSSATYTCQSVSKTVMKQAHHSSVESHDPVLFFDCRGRRIPECFIKSGSSKTPGMFFARNKRSNSTDLRVIVKHGR